MSDNTVASHLTEHPVMTGVLVTMLLLISRAGSAAAAAGASNCGP